MRLLSSLLLSLFLVFSSMAAPMAEEEPRTTVEIVYETVTRTVVHEVTEPTPVADEVEEGSGVAEEVQAPEQNNVLVPEQNNVVAPEQNNVLVPAADTASDTVPCECETEDETAAPASDISEMSGTAKVCSCDVADACRKESMKETETCMEQCQEEHLKTFGDKTEDYRKCFAKYKVTIGEAEDCLFKNKADYCTTEKDDKFITKTNWDDLATIKYSSTPDKAINNTFLWNRDESKYNKFQSFFHCTKHCIHKKLQDCTNTKGCTIKMPARDEFANKMKQCTKKNVKISTGILQTCQCLAWTHGVKELQGSCVVIGNSFYVDRA